VHTQGVSILEELNAHPGCQHIEGSRSTPRVPAREAVTRILNGDYLFAIDRFVVFGVRLFGAYEPPDLL
jgi:hypothetical protein